MGQKIQVLSERKLSRKSVFNNRFVVEVCETIHVHYRNLRLLLSVTDWEMLSKGMVDAFDRWRKRGEPDPGKHHIELCRKQVATFPHNDGIMISLNKNLYKPNEGRIYSAGAAIDDKEYIHFKYRDLRMEMTIEEFRELSDTFKEAREKLDERSVPNE